MIKLPDEVVEAAARAAWNTQREHWGLYKVMLETEGHLPPYEELGRGKQRELLVEARAAIAAGLAAWSGMHVHETRRSWLGGFSERELMLPLPQEASNDQA